MIILDLEWNRSYDNKPLHEILQIGAVRVARLGGPILDTFNAYIRPMVHKRFDPGARNLPELQACRDSDLDFAGAMERFLVWSAGETVYGFWGQGDMEILEENCRYWSLPAPAAEKVYDLQSAFAYMLGTGQQMALWRVAGYCGIPDTFTFHNALNDAMYTALVSAQLTPEALEGYAQAQKRLGAASFHLSSQPFSRQPRQKVGPFSSVAELLNARASRKPVCPFCGWKGSVVQWYFPKPRRDTLPQQYYAVFSCPEHGRFLCRLTAVRLADGTWRGRRTVPPITPQLVEEYAAAVQGCTHVCQGRRRRRRPERSGGIPENT